MKHLLCGATIALLGGMTAAPTLARDMTSPTATMPAPVIGTAAADLDMFGPITGIPGYDVAVAASCTETELAAARDLVTQVPPDLRPSAEVIWSTANELQNDQEPELCAQKLNELDTLAQAGRGELGAAALTARGFAPGYVASPRGLPLTASACTELDMARAASMIDEAPSSLRPDLQQRLAAASDDQNANDFQSCSQILASIRTIAQAAPDSMVASPE